ncbi:MAG: DUF3179 domain-containing protein [Solirubrobacterales bacterium]
MTRIALAAAIAGALLAGCGGNDERSAQGPVEDIPFDTSDWETDFAEHSVDLDEFQSGGPPKDGIPSIDDPKFVSVDEADGFLDPAEPVAVLELSGRARAYPIQILTWHEIVNDTIDGEAVAVTYCPLCNSTVAFRREVGGEPVEFGTTGMLRNSDLVMYDRRTESWWQQITAEAVVGEKVGTELETLPSQILSWEELRRLHPDAEVLSRDTGFERDYGENPYAGYESDPDSQPFLFQREVDASLPPKERVAAVKSGAAAVVYPFSRLRDEAPINDDLGRRPIVVFFNPDVASALDSPFVADGKAVGAAALFEAVADGEPLSFEATDEPGEFRDHQTGSVWDMSGRAISGALQGAELEQIEHDDQFWFALAAFFPDAEIRG